MILVNVLRLFRGGFNMWAPKRPHETLVVDNSLRFNNKRFEDCKLMCKGKYMDLLH